MLTKALVIFVDIRGFTNWSADADVHANVVTFVNAFDEILLNEFPDFYRKMLGDGAMLVRELPDNPPPMEVIATALQAIDQVQAGFFRLCDSFYTEHGVRTELRLGWGITRGDVWTNRSDHINDYLGKNINEAARLCSQARPHGVVIDADDFRDIPESHERAFQHLTLKLDGFEAHIAAWVTQDIAARVLPSDRFREHPLVFVSGVCYRRELGRIEVLVMKRNAHREFFPGMLEITTGGQLAKDESFTEGVVRHFRRELGIAVDVDATRFTTYQFGNRDGELIPGIRYLCRHIEGKPQLIHYEEFNWMTLDKLREVPEEELLPGAKENALTLLEPLAEVE